MMKGSADEQLTMQACVLCQLIGTLRGGCTGSGERRDQGGEKCAATTVQRLIRRGKLLIFK